MSAGFGACNLNASPLEFVGPAAPSSAANSEVQASVRQASVRQASEPQASERQTGCEAQSDPDENDLANEVNSAAGETRQPVVAVPKKLQRVGEARQQQGFSLRTISRRTGIDLRSLRSHEIPTTDMKLSDLRAWQLALEVPLVDLIEDDAQPLSSPVKDRANLVRIMKTVVAIKEAGGSPRIQRLAEMLFEQMVELMPELKEVGGWPQHGSRRSNGSSRIVEQQVNTQALGLEKMD